MGLGTIFFLAIGLSMDAFAVSVSSGTRARSRLLWNALIIGLFFGAFQALMPALGWAAGLGVRNLIADYDHWIAFVLLTFLGCKMFYEALSTPDGEEGRVLSLTLSLLLTLSIATSIDALAVGFTFSTIKIAILRPVLIIGFVTFVISMTGVLIGNKCGEFFGRKMEFLGGLILIAIGVKILMAHLFPALGGGMF